MGNLFMPGGGFALPGLQKLKISTDGPLSHGRRRRATS